jgi:(E)-4-hydroxy-3-methylbut-2-enyl-diphosphate synthase
VSSTITRRRTVPVNVGGVIVGGAAPIPVQTMTKTQTEDVAATLAQIERAAKAGADIIRVTCDTAEAGVALREIVKGSPIPVIADVHYDAPLALRALEAGIACLRLNPGNITDPT